MITKITNGKEVITGSFEVTKGLLIKNGITAYDRTWWHPVNFGKSYVMLDLETMGLDFNAAVVQISAVEFDLITGLVLSSFTVNVDYKSAVEAGLTTTDSTVKFWHDQPPEVQERVLIGGISLKDALEQLHNYLNKLGTPYVWGNGVRADNVWILSAFRALGMPDPFAYNKDLDYRTLYQLAELKADLKGDPKPWKDLPFVGFPHYSLDDCYHQIKKATLMWNYLYA